MRFKAPTQLQGISDLTLVATIKPGLVPGVFESISHAQRLRLVLGLLDAARRRAREADLVGSPFADNVGRLRAIHFFRFAVDEPGRQLFLNVTFDGGWEPYMRLIWGPLGKLLDLIFCHCEGYPLAAASSHDTYAAWVRQQELPSQFLYADSGASVVDRSYLAQQECSQRLRGGERGADLRAARTALAPPRPVTPDNGAAVEEALRSLAALFGLVRVFGMPQPVQPDVVADDDGSVLLRFARDYLSDLCDWQARGLFEPGAPLAQAGAPLAAALEWLRRMPTVRAVDTGHALPAPEELQAGLLQPLAPPPQRHARGAVVLLQVLAPDAARDWLAQAAPPPDQGGPALIADGRRTELATDRIEATVAITFAGLRALGVPASRLEAMPGEFQQGMEGRAAVLGDVRANHPRQWRRPREAGSGLPIGLGLVHLVLQLRTAEADDEAGDDRAALLPRLARWLQDQVPAQAVRLLAVEPTWSRPPAHPASPDHFGFADGISQPVIGQGAAGRYWDDGVPPGELLVGWANGRGDGPPLQRPAARVEAAEAAVMAARDWLEGGSFLVLRKIRQDVERFDAAAARTARAMQRAGVVGTLAEGVALVRAKLLGRHADGRPLAPRTGASPNDFDYAGDPQGATCPFASHVRRANPRTAGGGPFGPVRIVRRGMSYGPPPGAADTTADRGVLFIAYNASIAEQYELIQRWLTLGNPVSGVPTAQPDPLLGVPPVDGPLVFRFEHAGQAWRVDLGTEPVCRLEWGLYAFVPPMALLRDLAPALSDPQPPGSRDGGGNPPAPAQQLAREHERQVKALLEGDPDSARRVWARVRREGGVRRVSTASRGSPPLVVVEGFAPATARGSDPVLVGSWAGVAEVLKDDGGRFSVSGYGTRMAQSIGGCPFGQDDTGPHDGHQRPFVASVKDAIRGAVDERTAVATAHRIVSSRLAAWQAAAAGRPTLPVDLTVLGTVLAAQLCHEWFGVPLGDDIVEGGLFPPPPPQKRHCPGGLLSVARWVFSAYPNERAEASALHAENGAKQLAQAAWAGGGVAPVRDAVRRALDPVATQALDAAARVDLFANIMLGLPATLIGSWVKLLRAWAGDGRLWALQLELVAHAGPGDPTDLGTLLRPALISTLAADPVADGIWRTAATTVHTFPGGTLQAGDLLWLGLGSALADGPADPQRQEALLFGNPDGAGTHACPGQRMAIGALLGAAVALLQAGELTPTAVPTVLDLRPFARPGTPPASAA